MTIGGASRFLVSEEMETPKGARMFTEAIDLDILVVEPQPSGKARLIHHEEVKTDLRDNQAKANRQLQNGRSLLHEAAAGTKFIRLRENGVHITDTIDMTSGSAITSATRGLAARGFRPAPIRWTPPIETLI